MSTNKDDFGGFRSGFLNPKPKQQEGGKVSASSIVQQPIVQVPASNVAAVSANKAADAGKIMGHIATMQKSIATILGEKRFQLNSNAEKEGERRLAEKTIEKYKEATKYAKAFGFDDGVDSLPFDEKVKKDAASKVLLEQASKLCGEISSSSEFKTKWPVLDKCLREFVKKDEMCEVYIGGYKDLMKPKYPYYTDLLKSMKSLQDIEKSQQGQGVAAVKK